MARDTRHSLQPGTDHDGNSRRLAVLACKQALRSTLQAAVKRDFETDADTVTEKDSYRLWSGINRASQDRMWRLLAQQIDADGERIQSSANKLALDAPGSLELRDDSIPAYQRQANIHGQPGGYMLDQYATDLRAGILYEAGGNLYALGQGIGARDSKGERLIGHITERFPGFAPRRILEMGCSAGGQSTDYPRAFPDAECIAIDLSPGMLRYAHARAAALKSAVNFKQRDAGDTGFADASFDLIISHNLFHEVAANHVPAVLRECKRLLRPGGICIHQDVPIQRNKMDSFTRFLSDWQVDHNDEPFWNDFADADLPGGLIDAGFDADSVTEEYLQAIDGPIPWYVVTAVASPA